LICFILATSAGVGGRLAFRTLPPAEGDGDGDDDGEGMSAGEFRDLIIWFTLIWGDESCSEEEEETLVPCKVFFLGDAGLNVAATGALTPPGGAGRGLATATGVRVMGIVLLGGGAVGAPKDENPSKWEMPMVSEVWLIRLNWLVS